MYVQSLLLPNEPERLLMGYTPEQRAWLKIRKEVWLTMLGKQHLFSHDPMLVVQYLNDAPFTTPISQESPGRLCLYRLANSGRLMKRERNVTPAELMKDFDYR